MRVAVCPRAGMGTSLLPRGSRIFEELFPGLLADLVAAGVPVSKSLDQLHVELNAHVLFRDGHDERSRRGSREGWLYQPTRPFLEARLRDRVRALANVAFMEGCEVDGLTSNDTRTRVTGARLVPRGRTGVRLDLPADLVVAATGRAGRASTWLEELGYASPPNAEVHVDLRYVTQRVRLPGGSGDGLQTILVGPTAQRPTSGFGLAQEDDQWLVSFGGYAGHHPPTDRSAWLALADVVMPRPFAAALHRSEPLEGPYEYGFMSSVRRHFEVLGRFPERLLVTGDAHCGFNPIYGQGMTVAALEALVLRAVLRGGWDDLTARFFHAAARPVGDAWRLAVGGDLALPASLVPGPRPLSLTALNMYVDRVLTAAEHDPVMTWRYFDVLGFLEPARALFTPDSLRRVFSDGRARRRTERAVLAGQLRQVWL